MSSSDADRAEARLREQSERAKQNLREGKEQAEEKLREGKDTFLAKLREDGVVRPQGLATAGFGLVFLAAVPLTSWIAQPTGVLESLVNGLCSSIAYLGTAGASSKVSPTGKIAALSTLYIAMTYAFSGAGSAAGVDASRQDGRDNNHPRAQLAGLKGLPLRLYSAHSNLMEMFPGFALVAALAQTMAPGDQTLVNLLGLHVISKVFLYYPAYIANLGAPRTIGHILATSSVINVALRLAKRPVL